MHQKKSFIHQPNIPEHPRIHHHAAAVDDIDFGDRGWLAGVDRHLFSLKETILTGAVEQETVGANLVRLIHKIDDGTENAVFRRSASGP